MAVTAEQIKGLKLINFLDVIYLGKITKSGSVTTITDAIVADQDFETTIKKYIKAENLGKLEPIEVAGSAAVFASKGFSEEQEMQIDMIVAKALYGMKYALKNLENSTF